jgi:branched-chain amino acid transport system permease protein
VNRALRPVSVAVGVVLVALLAVLPWLSIPVPWLLPGDTDTPGSLQLMGLCLLLAALALSYHLIFGLAGLLSFGHALYFAAGAYGLGLLLDRPAWPLAPAVVVTFGAVAVIAVVVGVVSLRVSGIAFAMVTLAFAQAGNVLARRNPHQLTGGEEGLRLETDRLPRQFVGVVNTRYLFWLALVIVVAVYVVVAWVEHSRAGHVAAATRENDLRVRVIGEQPKHAQLLVFVLAAVLAAIAGMGHLLLQSGVTPNATSADFTLTILVMVVLGGVGARWGAVAGAVIYTLADQRLGVFASSEAVDALPSVLRVPLSQPLFILGVAFILVVLFLPGGLAGTLTRLGLPGLGRRLDDPIADIDLGDGSPDVEPELQPDRDAHPLV